MSAKEMFEKLGYQNDYNNRKYMRYHNEEYDCYIWFDLLNKNIEINGSITVQELQAINKQVEELEWLGSDTSVKD